MAGEKKILEIPVDTSEFDAFLAKFNEYQERAKSSPDPFAKAAASFRESADAAEALGAAVGGLAKSVSGSKMVGGQSFIAQWAKHSRESREDWTKMSKSVDKANHDMRSLNRSWINFKALKKDALIAGGAAAGGVAAMVKANSDVARQNLEAKSLGIPVGRAKAFEADYEPLGLQRSDLSKFANAKEDRTLWKPLVAAGLSTDQIQSLDPDELAIAFARKAGEKYHGWEAGGMPAAQIAKSYGFTDLLGTGTLRAAGSWSDQQWNDTHAKYLADAKSMGIDSKTADQATEFKQKWSSDLGRVGNAFDAALVRASGGLGHFADAASDAAIKIINAAAPWVDKAANGVGNTIDTLSAGESFVSPENGGPQYKPYDVRDGFRMVGDKIRSVFPGIPDVSQPGVTRAPNSTGFTGDPKRDQTLKALERTFNLKAGVLDNLERQESSRGKNPNLGNNDMDGPAGPFQMTKGTAASVGVYDRTDEQQSATGAARYLSMLLRKYKGDYAKSYAAYDGFSGLDADIKKYGDKWRDHMDEFGSAKAVGETSKYLRDMEAHANDFTSKFSDAKTDTAIQSNAPTLDDSQFQIVDLSQEGKPQQDTKPLIDLDGMHQWAAKYFGEGGGAEFRTSKRIQTADNKPVNVNLSVKVSTPAGASTTVSQNSIPH